MTSECVRCQDLSAVLRKLATRIGFLCKAMNRRPRQGYGFEARKLQELFQEALDGKAGPVVAEVIKSVLPDGFRAVDKT